MMRRLGYHLPHVMYADHLLVLTSRDVAILAIISLAAVVVLLAVRAFRHRAHIGRIPLRIHIAGVRGKSTLVRLIAAGLRGDRRRVFAKTTGTEPMLIDAEGIEQPWHRIGSASVHEQRHFLRLAARALADVVVVESMAIRGEYLWASEHLLVQATDTVVTNIRVDHQEVYGDDPNAVAHAMAEVVPVGTRLWLAAAIDVRLQERALAQGNDVRHVTTEGVSPEEANRRLAIAVCHGLGVPVATARSRMDALAPTDSAFSITPLQSATGTVNFANAFACNDVTSLDLLFREVQPQGTGERDVVFLNARADRPLRTRTFLRYLDRQHPRARVFVTHPAFTPAPSLRRRPGTAPLSVVRPRVPRAVLDALIAAAGDGGHIWGIGNYHGLGAELIRLLSEEAPCSPPR